MESKPFSAQRFLLFSYVVIVAIVPMRAHAVELRNQPQFMFTERPRLVTQLGHGAMIDFVTFSKNGDQILTASQDGTACIWDTESGREVQRFEVAPGKQTFRAWATISSNGRYVLVSSNHTQLFDVATGKELKRFIEESGPVAFSPIGFQFLTGGKHIRDGSSGNVVFVFDAISKPAAIAFSSDGRFLLTAEKPKLAKLWDSVTGRELRQFTGHVSDVNDVAFSNDGTIVLTGSSDRTARLWNAATGQELRRFDGGPEGKVALSPDGQLVLTASGTQLILWDATSTKIVRRWEGHIGVVRSLVFSPNGRYILGGGDLAACLWEVSGTNVSRCFVGQSDRVYFATFSKDGSYLLVGDGSGSAHLWNMHSGQVVKSLKGHAGMVYRGAWSFDSELIATVGRDRTARIWNKNTGSATKIHERLPLQLHAAAFAPKDYQLLTNGPDGEALLLDVITGSRIQRYVGHSKLVTSGAFSHNGVFIVTGSEDETVRLWDKGTGKEAHRFQGHTGAVTSVAFSPLDDVVLTGSSDSTARLWNLRGQEIQKFSGHTDKVTSVAFSSSGQFVLTGSKDNTARLWDAKFGKELQQFQGHSWTVSSVALLSDDKFALTGSYDGTVRLWKVDPKSPQGIEVAQLATLRDGTWVVSTPDGRFDTNNLEELKELHWVMPDDPLRALPLEIFMRDYYEPRLLPRVLAGEKLPTIRSLAELNRAQPKVEIVGVERERDAESHPTDTVRVTVQVTETSETFGLEGQQRRMETGVYDLRLFRDGQLVAQEPPAGHSATTGLSADDELQQWRHERRVVDLKDGRRKIVFKGIRLPRRAGIKEVKFSAYAFNEDRVKSQTAQAKPFTIPADLSPRKPKAYLVTVGVNAFEDDHWDLDFAVNDATQLGQVLKPRLEAQHDAQGQPRYEDVVWVGLTAEARIDQEGTRHLIKVQAYKAQIEAVLKTLADQPVNTEVLKGIEHADKLQRANPEDLVLLAFSTHGEVDDLRGRFYLLPHDIGSHSTKQQRRARSISNDELSAWLHGLDAIDLVMIVDACHSAASVESQDFKPGPMGSRGLGQLAYDKGMRILAASQSTESANETLETKMGLLSYALVREGLEENQADYKPKDEQIWLSEWLGYAMGRVPEFYKKPNEGPLKRREKGTLLMSPKKPTKEFPALQQPALFDFAFKRDVVIGRAR